MGMGFEDIGYTTGREADTKFEVIEFHNHKVFCYSSDAIDSSKCMRLLDGDHASVPSSGSEFQSQTQESEAVDNPKVYSGGISPAIGCDC